MNIQKTITIASPPHVIWEWLTDLEKLKMWSPSILDERNATSDQNGKPLTSEILMQEGKKQLWFQSEMHEYNPNEGFKMSISGGSLGKNAMQLEYQLKKLNEMETELHYWCIWNPKGLILRLFAKLIENKSSKKAAESLVRLKKFSENND